MAFLHCIITVGILVRRNAAVGRVIANRAVARNVPVPARGLTKHYTYIGMRRQDNAKSFAKFARGALRTGIACLKAVGNIAFSQRSASRKCYTCNSDVEFENGSNQDVAMTSNGIADQIQTVLNKCTISQNGREAFKIVIIYFEPTIIVTGTSVCGQSC